jgi:Lar family restriction alleviation protein
MSDEPPLIDCPFCGACDRPTVFPEVLGKINKIWYVRCVGCHARGPIKQTMEEACEAWNIRAIILPR